MIDRDAVHNKMRELGYVIFDKDLDMNVVGLRRVPQAAPNTFDDAMTLSYKEGSEWRFHSWPCTTDPGTYWLQNPMFASGTGVLCPGQYRSSHSLGMHRGTYPALVQTGKLKLWLDANRDAIIDHDPERVIEGKGYGINIHHAGAHSTRVDKWSAGCQVFANTADYDEFMELVKRQIAAGLGSTYTYTLLEWPAEGF